MMPVLDDRCRVGGGICALRVLLLEIVHCFWVAISSVDDKMQDEGNLLVTASLETQVTKVVSISLAVSTV